MNKVLTLTAVIDGLEVSLVPIVDGPDIKVSLNQIVVAINEIARDKYHINTEEVIAAVDIDAIVAQITANVQVSLEILETCIGQDHHHHHHQLQQH